MKIQFLGTGTSVGVPVIGCRCEVCRSQDVRDWRMRASVVVEQNGQRILIDCGPDFRSQCLRYGYNHFDALFLTHKHYDHVGGLDDIRPFGDLHIYSDDDVQEAIHRCLPYCFGAHVYPGAPRMHLHRVEAFQPVDIDGFGEVMPLRVMHGRLPILGYRIGRFAYITDCKTLPEESLEALKGIDVLVINALRDAQHPAHLTVEEALAVIRNVAPKAAYLTHFCHDIGLQAAKEKTLPENVFMAYDGLELEIS